MTDIFRLDYADVAILKLSSPAVLNDNVALVEPKCDAVMARGDTCSAIGWGYINHNCKYFIKIFIFYSTWPFGHMF